MTQRSLIGAILVIVCCPLVGCWSAYHQAGKELVPDARSRLATRIHEARVAAADAEQVLSEPAADPSEQAERLESCSWELSKRVASVHDVADRLDLSDDPIAEVVAAFDRADKQVAAAADATGASASPSHEKDTLTAVAMAVARADAYLGGQAGIVQPK
jgi:hypothetical protein